MNPYDQYQFNQGIKMRNRLVMAPMTTYSGNQDLTVSDEELHYYKLRSQSVGMVVTAATSVNEYAQAFEHQISLKHDRFIPSMAQLATTIKNEGALAVVQLHHGGRMNLPLLYDHDHDIVSASAVKAPREGLVIPRAMTETEIKQTIADFAQATKRAILAGFDGVELHGANTYLIQQFFSPHSNRRTDRYGGTLEQRMTFAIELIDACVDIIKTHAKQPFLLGYRFSPEELEDPGITLSDTKALVGMLKRKPLDFLHISLKHYAQTSQRNTNDPMPIVEHIQSSLLGALPLIGVGHVKTHEDVEDALNRGYDLVASGMPLIADPDWGFKLKKQETPSKIIDAATLPTPLYQRLINHRGYYESTGYTFKG